MNIAHRRVYVHVPHHFFHRADRRTAVNRSRSEGMSARAVKVNIIQVARRMLDLVLCNRNF